MDNLFFQDLETKDNGLIPMSLEEFNSVPHDKPYLNSVKFKPNKREYRDQKDDKAILIDTNPLPKDVSVKERLHMSKNEFDEVFRRTMNYIRDVETILYENVQKGVSTIGDLDKAIIDYFNRNCPEIQSEVDRQQLLKKLNTAIVQYYVLQPLIDNPDTTDIKVCGVNDIRVRIKGEAYSSTSHFLSVEDLNLFIHGLCLRNRVDFYNSPVITFTDNHDKNYILRFLISSPEINAVDYPYLSIRKGAKNKPDWEELKRRGMVNDNIIEYMKMRAKYSKCIAIAGPPGCVDCETEFFNGKEWKFISEYQEEEPVLQYDTTTQVASLVAPTHYIKEPCEKMNHFETNKGIDQMLSDEHRVLYLKKTHKDGKKIWGSTFHEMSAEELFEKQNNGKFWGGFQTSFNYDGKGILLTDAEIKVMLAVICDGTFDKRNESNLRCSLNLKKERKIIEAKRILDEANIPYKETTKKNGYKLIVFQAPRREKVFTSDWYDCSKHQLQLICDNILQWDGHIDKIGRKQFYSSIKTSIDFVQFAFSSCGYRATISELDRTGTFKTINEKSYERKTKEYSVTISTNNIVAMGHHKSGNGSSPMIEKVDTKDGYKYCFTVPTHALVLRRNGKIFITGNSGKTTFFNALIEDIPKTRETLVIQENDELFTNQPGFLFKHVTHGFDGRKPYTLEDLGRMALVEGCNEFIIGEVKGPEMRNVMTLLNSGGYAAYTIHATNAYEVLEKSADLVKYGSSYSLDEARRMLRTIDTIVYLEGYKVREILENHGYDDDTNQFKYEQIYQYDYHNDIK